MGRDKDDEHSSSHNLQFGWWECEMDVCIHHTSRAQHMMRRTLCLWEMSSSSRHTHTHTWHKWLLSFTVYELVENIGGQTGGWETTYSLSKDIFCLSWRGRALTLLRQPLGSIKNWSFIIRMPNLTKSWIASPTHNKKNSLLERTVSSLIIRWMRSPIKFLNKHNCLRSPPLLIFAVCFVWEGS